MDTIDGLFALWILTGDIHSNQSFHLKGLFIIQGVDLSCDPDQNILQNILHIAEYSVKYDPIVLINPPLLIIITSLHHHAVISYKLVLYLVY